MPTKYFIARREKLLPFDRQAVTRVIEHGSLLADDAEKLSAQTLTVADLLRKADYLAGAAGRTSSEPRARNRPLTRRRAAQTGCAATSGSR